MRTRSLALALALLLGGLTLGAAAHDVRAWQTAFRRGDSQLGRDPAHADWRASMWLPKETLRHTLSIDSRLRLRRALKTFAAATQMQSQPTPDPEAHVRMRVTAEVALADEAQSRDALSASRAANLLGILAAGDPGHAAAQTRATESFVLAIRRDPANTQAKFNLELLLRRARTQGSRDAAGGGASHDRGGRGAGRGARGRGF